MAKRRRRTARTTPPAQKALITRPAVWLATLSTVVGVATGMFTLRDQVLPREASTAEAGADYQRSIGRICDARNAGETARHTDSERLRTRLRRARTNLAQRNALLDVQRRILARSNDDLARLRGLEAPRKLTPGHRAATAALTRNNDRIQDYVQRLSSASTRDDLLDAGRALAKMRPAIAHDSVALNARLIRLGGRECDLDPPTVTSTIMLPALARPHREPKRPAAKKPDPAATTSPEAQEPVTPVQQSPPSSGGAQPPMTPPSTGGGGAGAGDGG
jgi:hypothetical protein